VTLLLNGEILAVDTPQNILQLGKTTLKIVVNKTENNTVIDSTAKGLADELKKSGLDATISSVELHADTIEDIILSMLCEKEKEARQ
jgi:hypothetical protein